MTDQMVSTLQQSLRGRVIGPGDVDYDAARALYNGMIDIARRASSIDTHGAVRRIDAHAPHHGEVDHQPVVATAQAWAIVAAATDGDQQALAAAEAHRGDDVGDVHAARDQAWPLVDHAIVKRTGGIVVNVTWTDDVSAEAWL